MDRRRASWGLTALLVASLAQAATQGPPVYTYTGTAPSGACVGTRVWIDALGSGTYYCNAGTWTAVGAPFSAYTVVYDESSALTQRYWLKFTGTGITCSDASPYTVCDVPAGAAPNATTGTAGVVLLGQSGASSPAKVLTETATGVYGSLSAGTTQGLLVKGRTVEAATASVATSGADYPSGPLVLTGSIWSTTFGQAFPWSGEIRWMPTYIDAGGTVTGGEFRFYKPDGTTVAATINELGQFSGRAATASALSTAGSATQFWKNGNAWGTPDWTDLSGKPSTFAPVDATAGVTGGIRLTGQLGGTATSPTVTGVTGAVVGVSNLNATGTPSATTYLRGDGTWSTPGGGGTPGGSSGQIQYNNGGAFSGAARTGIDAVGNIVLPGGAEPAVPASGVTLFSEDRGDVSLLASIGVQGYDRYAQPHFGMENVAMMFPAGGATGTTAPSVIGMTVTHEGTTIANPAPASTNFYAASTRITSTSGTTVGNGSGWRAGQLRYWRGNAAGLGGYHCHFRWCNDTATASNRGLVGLQASTSARANQNPSADLNFVGAFWDSGSTSILLGGNDGTGTATATTTCSATDFPPRTQNHCFSLDLAAKKNGSQVTAYLKRLDTSGITPCTATISAAGDQPANTAFLAPRITYQTSTTSATGVGVLKMYCEQDN